MSLLNEIQKKKADLDRFGGTMTNGDYSLDKSISAQYHKCSESDSVWDFHRNILIFSLSGCGSCVSIHETTSRM